MEGKEVRGRIPWLSTSLVFLSSVPTSLACTAFTYVEGSLVVFSILLMFYSLQTLYDVRMYYILWHYIVFLMQVSSMRAWSPCASQVIG